MANEKILTRIAGMPIGATFDDHGNPILETYATISFVQTQVASAVHFKGSVAHGSVPTTNLSVGDLWNITDQFAIRNLDGAIVDYGTSGSTNYPAGTNVVWDGEKWDSYGGSEIAIDSTWSTTSTAPLQNQTITNWRNSAFESPNYTKAKSATTADGLASAPSLSYTAAADANTDATLTVTAGGLTSAAATISKVRNAFKADSATDSTYASKIGTNASHTAIGGPTIPVYVNANGVVSECTSYANMTAGKATADASGNNIVDTYATKAELATVAGGSQATITGAASSITTSNLTANKVVISDDNGKIAASEMSSTALRSLSWDEDPVAKTFTLTATRPDGTTDISIVFGYIPNPSAQAS